MLTEQRFERILERLKVKKSITVAEITEDLGISESTARRDITALDKAGKLTKVFGGAVAAEHTYEMKEPTVAQKVNVRKEEKIKIAQYAADMIGDNDFVYLDAGTSVGYMVEFLAEKRAAFVTNAVAHAQRLAAQGNRVLLIGGELKSSTEAVVGAQAIELLRKYHFTKGFFGTNGITKEEGFTTPDVGEAQVKQTAVQQCQKSYILADSTKFGNISAVTFAPFSGSVILTEETGNIKAGFRHAGRKRSVFSSLPVMWIDLNFSCYFSAFSIASCAAFLIPVELNVAPLIVSTSADCASIIFGMIASAFDRYALSSPSADVMARSVIWPPSTVTSTAMMPPKPSASPSYVPSTYCPSASAASLAAVSAVLDAAAAACRFSF